MKLLVLLCLVGAALAAPSVIRSNEEVEAYRIFLESAKPDSGKLLEDAIAENPKANAWENSGKYQGDILLNDEQVENMVSNYAGSRSGLIWPQVRWPGNTIVYEFAAGHFSAGQRQAIVNAYRDIEAQTCVRFRQRTNENDFVRITNHQDGCYANVGFWVNFGAHTLNLANGCFNHFIIIHEWFHVVGLMHMHQTYRRYNYIWINWQNIGQGMASQFDLNSEQEVTMLGTPYEYASNQHYDAYAFSFNGQPTIGARFDTGGNMGQLSFVTHYDWVRVRRMYNCPGAWSEGVIQDDPNNELLNKPEPTNNEIQDN